MTYRDVEIIVAITMNLLEQEYGVADLDSFGQPTVMEIAETIWNENYASS